MIINYLCNCLCKKKKYKIRKKRTCPPGPPTVRVSNIRTRFWLCFALGN